MTRANIFGYPVDLTTLDEAVNFALKSMLVGQGLHVVTINPEIIAAADKNPQLADIINNAELVIPDSVGMMLAIRSLGFFKAEKIPGIEFSEKLLQKCAEKNLKVGFLGGTPEVIEKIKDKFPHVNIIFSNHGYFKEEELNNIHNSLLEQKPAILLVGLGCPKQDFFINKIKNDLKETTMIGVGGSFDVWAKKVKRAPVFFQIFGLEWFYRLITQPERFNRMFPVLPIFFLRVLFDRRHLEKKYENE